VDVYELTDCAFACTPLSFSLTLCVYELLRNVFLSKLGNIETYRKCEHELMGVSRVNGNDETLIPSQIKCSLIKWSDFDETFKD